MSGPVSLRPLLSHSEGLLPHLPQQEVTRHLRPEHQYGHYNDNDNYDNDKYDNDKADIRLSDVKHVVNVLVNTNIRYKLVEIDPNPNILEAIELGENLPLESFLKQLIIRQHIDTLFLFLRYQHLSLISYFVFSSRERKGFIDYSAKNCFFMNDNY